jgi:hypothetical protein
MPYRFSQLLAETGRSIAKPVFDPPTLTPLRKPIANSTIGLFVSCGAQLPDDPLYRNGGLAISAAHMAAHAAVGESLVGKERAFAVKCNC